MPEENLRDWLILIRAPGLGGRRLIDLTERFGDAAGVCRSGVRQSAALGLDSDTARALTRPDDERIEADLEWLRGPRRHLVTWADERYPGLLRRIPSPPAALFVEGDPETLWRPQLAIVGSRNPTRGGLDHARAFSSEMCRLGLAVCSGLAGGIDAAAHAAALDAGGTTIAVTGTGLDRVYPTSSAGLAERIPESGALVSEFPPATPARRSHFPSRNRIIAGLSLGVLVVEAGLNSGSLITARQAAEQGKEVFALPGSLHNPMVRGCHRLIKEGARLAENSADILGALAPLAGELADVLQEALRPEVPPAPAGHDLFEDPDYARLWAVLSHDPVSVDTLVRECGLGVREVSSMLLMLELKGLVRGEAGSTYCRHPQAG